MKVIGLILVVLTGGLLGLGACMGLRQRVRTLRQVVLLTGRLEDGIRYTAAPIGKLMRECRVSPEFAEFPLLEKACSLLEDGMTPPQAWMTALKPIQRSDGLTPTDRELLVGFFTGLGTTDAEGQRKNCEHYRRLLTDSMEDARTEAAQKERLYLTLGVTGGLLLALLLA